MAQPFRWMVYGWLGVVGVSGQVYAQQFTQASLGSGSVQANQGATDGFFSGDGNSILFFSNSTNLVPSDTNNAVDIFVRNLGSGAVERVTVATDGSERTGVVGRSLPFTVGSDEPLHVSLSHDASVVAFATTDAYVPSDTATCTQNNVPRPCVDVYIRDRNLGTTLLGSLVGGNNDSYDPQVSANGRFVIFTSLASNFTPQDTNGVSNVYMRDLVGILPVERVSLSSSGQELDKPSWFGRISGDGEWITFLSEATVVPEPDPMPCLTQLGVAVPSAACGRAYLRNRFTGVTKRLPIPLSVSPQGTSTGALIKGLAMTPDGRYIAMHGNAVMDNKYSTFVVVYDRVTDRADVAFVAPFGYRSSEVSMSDNGRMVAVSVAFDDAISRPAVIADRVTHTVLTPPDLPVLDQQPAPARPPVRFNADGLRIIYNEISARVPTDTNGTDDVYIYNRDVDGDGMTDLFETKFGLNPNDPADGPLDADGDGVTNAQEHVNGTHPKGTFKRYFAEGAANSFFTTRFALFNPSPAAATVYLEFLGSNGQTSSTPIQLAANGWTALTLSDLTIEQPNNDFSTVIESDQPIVADRTMSWDKSGYGSHAETAIEAPGTTWYLAEGATHGSFDLFYLLQNPGDVAASVEITYLRPAGFPPITKGGYVVPPRSRLTIHVDEESPGLAATDVSAKITSNQPILAERAMYFSTPTQAFAAGHEGAGVKAPATSWFLAEGATGSFFDLFLLIANAETTATLVKVTYLLPSGDPIVKHYSLSSESRLTIPVDGEDPRLIDTPVSMIVESESPIPVIAERAMWWPSPDWYEAHLSAGATTTGTKWALAEGIVTNTPGNETETFILIANTSATAGNADVTLFFGDGTSMTKNIELPANSRTNVRVQTEFPNAIGKGGYGTIIQSNGVPIVVERAMYSNANGQTWAAGTDALATKLQ